MWNTTTEPIAIIGSGCKFPGGSTTPSKLWELLKDPKDIVSEIRPDRFDVDKYFHPDHKHHGTSNVRHSYFLEENFKHFDAKFFGIRPQEAMAMDPQQRFLLETVYESLEAAGITISDLKGSQAGVFVGNMGVDYSELCRRTLMLSRPTLHRARRGASCPTESRTFLTCTARRSRSIPHARRAWWPSTRRYRVSASARPRWPLFAAPTSCWDQRSTLPRASFKCFLQTAARACGMRQRMGMPAARALPRSC